VDEKERERRKFLFQNWQRKRALFICRPSFGGMVIDVEHVGSDNMGRF